MLVATEREALSLINGPSRAPLPYEFRHGGGLWNENGEPILEPEVVNLPDNLAFWGLVGGALWLSNFFSLPEHVKVVQGDAISDFWNMLWRPEGRTVLAGFLGFGIGAEDIWQASTGRPLVERVVRSGLNGVEVGASLAAASALLHERWGVPMPDFTPVVEDVFFGAMALKVARSAAQIFVQPARQA